MTDSVERPTTDILQIVATLTSLPEVLDVLLSPVDDAALRTRPAEGEWCPMEVIGHLIACDSGAFRDRIRAIVDGAGPIPPFDPWAAINARDFANSPLQETLDELRQERSRSASLLQSLHPEELERVGSFVDDDRLFAASDFVHEWPFHDQDHLQQILQCLKLRHIRNLTPTMRQALIPSEAD